MNNWKMDTFSKVYERLSIGNNNMEPVKLFCIQYFKSISKIKRKQEISLPGENGIFLTNAKGKTKLTNLIWVPTTPTRIMIFRFL